ncbi:MAG: tetratricopeptide repeat protein, partial [Thermofilaceae archaeon]
MRGRVWKAGGLRLWAVFLPLLAGLALAQEYQPAGFVLRRIEAFDRTFVDTVAQTLTTTQGVREREGQSLSVAVAQQVMLAELSLGFMPGAVVVTATGQAVADPERARAYAEVLRGRGPSYELGLTLMDAGDLKGAEETFRRLVALGEVRGRLGLALVSYARGEWAAGVREALGAAESLRSAEAWQVVGLGEIGRGRAEEAVRAFRRAVELSPGYGPSWAGLVVSYLALGNPLGAYEAVRAGDRAVRGEYWEYRMARGLALYRVHRLTEALEEIRWAAGVYDGWEARANLALVQEALGEGREERWLGEAAGNLREALRRGGPRGELLAGLGLLQFRLRALRDAEETLTESLRLAPGFAAGWANRALVRLERQEYRGALADLERALSLEGAPMEARLALGLARL